jgi:hypothetical protein
MTVVVDPSRLRRRDVVLMSPLRIPVSNVAVPPEIDPVSWTEIHPILQDASSDSLHVGAVALLDPDQCNAHFRGRHALQAVEPVPEGACASR